MTSRPRRDPRWDIWLAGYEAGVLAGTDLGRRDVLAALIPAAEALAATRPHCHPSHDVLTRRRTTYSRPALTPEQIRDQARRSWSGPGELVTETHTEEPMPDPTPLAPTAPRLAAAGRAVDDALQAGRPRAALSACATATGEVQAVVRLVLDQLDAAAPAHVDVAQVRSLTVEAIARLGEAAARLHAAVCP